MVNKVIKKGNSEIGESYEKMVVEPFMKYLATILEYRKDTKDYELWIYPQINSDGGHDGLIATHGNGLVYINSKFVLKPLDPGDMIKYPSVRGAVTISCFPNCCGKGLITAGNTKFGTHTRDEAYMMMYLGLLMAKESGYTSITGIDVATSDNIEIYEKAKFKHIETVYRKNFPFYSATENAKNTQLYTYTRELHDVNAYKLMEELKSLLSIKEVKQQLVEL